MILTEQILLIVLLLTGSFDDQRKVKVFDGETFKDNLVYVADQMEDRKFIFRNCTFNGDVHFRSSAKEVEAEEVVGFDSIVFDNCLWTGYKSAGLMIRGAHKFVSVQNCRFIALKDGKKKRALAISAHVKPIDSKDWRVGDVIIKKNVIIHHSPGEGLFGQKLSKLHILDNEWMIEGGSAAAIKLDDVNGDSIGFYQSDVMISGNRFNIIYGYSAITLENTIWQWSTQNVKIYDNWLDHKIAFTNGSIKGLEVKGNTWDYTKRPKDGKPSYYYMNRVFSNAVWEDNEFIRDENSKGTSLELNPGVDPSVLSENKVSDWENVRYRNNTQ